MGKETEELRGMLKVIAEEDVVKTTDPESVKTKE